GEGSDALESHLSNVPAIGTDAFTLNLIELSALIVSKTGTCARLIAGNADSANSKTNPIPGHIFFLFMNSPCETTLRGKSDAETAGGLELHFCRAFERPLHFIYVSLGGRGLNPASIRCSEPQVHNCQTTG